MSHPPAPEALAIVGKPVAVTEAFVQLIVALCERAGVSGDEFRRWFRETQQPQAVPEPLPKPRHLRIVQGHS